MEWRVVTNMKVGDLPVEKIPSKFWPKTPSGLSRGSRRQNTNGAAYGCRDDQAHKCGEEDDQNALKSLQRSSRVVGGCGGVSSGRKMLHQTYKMEEGPINSHQAILSNSPLKWMKAL